MLLLQALNEGTFEAEGPQLYLAVGTHIVGRDEGCPIRLTEDRSISREHAQIVVHSFSTEGWAAEIVGTLAHQASVLAQDGMSRPSMCSRALPSRSKPLRQRDHW